MQLSRRRIRLACDARSTGQVKDVFTQASPDGWNSNDTQIEIALFDADALVTDIANIQSLTLAINELSDRKTAVITPITVAAADLDATVTVETWEDGTKQHALIPLTNEEFNFDLGGETSKSFWLAVYVTTKDTPARTYTVGTSILRILEDGTPPTGAPTPGDPLYLDAGQSDARYGALITDAKEIRVDGTAGSDATGTRGRPDKPFATIGAALAVALAGDRVLVAPGTYTATAALSVPDGVSLRGAGMRVTTITNSATMEIVKLIGSSEVEGFTITGTSTTIEQYSVAVVTAAAGKTVILRSLELVADAYGVYVSYDAVSPTVIGYDLRIRTKAFGAKLISSGGASMRLYNPDIVVDGPSAVVLEEYARGLSVVSGVVECYGGRVRVSDSGTYDAHGAEALVGGTMRLIGVDIEAAATGGSSYDLYEGTGSVEVAGCMFDPAATSGAVSYVDAEVILTAIGAADGVLPVSVGGTGASSIPKFSVHKNNVGQTTATSTSTKLTWSTEEYDIGGWFDTTNSKVIAPRAGAILFNAAAMPLSHNDGAQLRLVLYKNGVEYRRLGNLYAAAGGGNTQVSGTRIVQVAANDEFEVYFYHENGADMTIFGNSAATYWEGIYLP